MTCRTLIGLPEAILITFNPDLLEKVHKDCTHALIGCVKDKQQLAAGINKELAHFREKRALIANRTGFVEEVLNSGALRAREIAKETLLEVKEKMGLL